MCAHIRPSTSCSRERQLEGLRGEGAETVEPILDSFGGYSTDNLSNFYYPYIIVLLMIFRDEVRQYHEHEFILPRIGTFSFVSFHLQTKQYQSDIYIILYSTLKSMAMQFCR